MVDIKALVWHENQMLGTVRLARAAKGKEGWCRTSILFCVGLKLESKGDGEAGGGVNLRTSGRGAGERHLRLTEVSAWMSLCVCVGSFLRSFSKLCNRQLTTRFLFFCPIYTSSALACLLACLLWLGFSYALVSLETFNPFLINFSDIVSTSC